VGGSGRRMRDGANVPPTRVASPPSQRRNVNPSARRRTVGLFALVLALLGGMILAVVLTSRHSQVRVPRLIRLTKEGVWTKANRIGLHPKFSSRFNQAPRGTVIGQAPRAGSKVNSGSTVRVTLSGGPPPVKVPRVKGESATAAQTVLRSIGLHATAKPVPAPGSTPGTVVGQDPASGRSLSPGATVTLSVAQTPRWRALTSFSGEDTGRSVPFKVRDTRWRIVYTMAYKGTCSLIFICSGPSAHVANLSGGEDPHGFDLNEGNNQIWTFDSGAGVYQVTITPGDDNARWSVQIQNYF
jgi:hypothetical protein